MADMIEIKHLNKYFGDLHVLKDINLTVKRGDRVLVITLQNLVLHLVAGLRHQAQQTGIKATGQALVHIKVLGRAVGGDHDLLVVTDKFVHQLEEVIHARALANDVLDVIDDKHVDAVVRLHNGGVALLLAVEFCHQIVQICLRVGVLHLDLGRFLCQLIFDGEQQVRLAQARFAVDEQRRAGTGRVCKHGEFERRSVGKAVLRSEDEVFKREFRIRCEGCPVRVFSTAAGVAVEDADGAADELALFAGGLPFIWVIMRRKSSADNVFLIAMPDSSPGVASCATGICVAVGMGEGAGSAAGATEAVGCGAMVSRETSSRRGSGVGVAAAVSVATG